MLRPSSFTFDSYKIDVTRSTVIFTYRVEFKYGIAKTFTDKIILKDVSPDLWEKVPKQVLESTLQALLIMTGINYWCVFPTNNIKIKGFTLTREQAYFWDSLYLKGLAEFFYEMKLDFKNLINFPYDESLVESPSILLEQSSKALLLNGAGKDSILSAEILKSLGTKFDFFTFNPKQAHKRIATLVGAETIRVYRHRDSHLSIYETIFLTSPSYPSVSTYTFIALLIAELLGYNSIIVSNERSADFGNLTYLGLQVNHQWCKSSEAEKMINDYIYRFITPSISTSSLLRKFSELEIIQRFVQYPQYFHDVTSCNTYFYLTSLERYFVKKGYWCRRCAKCVFLFACFAAYLPKKEVITIFGGDLYNKKRLIPLFKRILGIEGFKPLDCVGEPEEMILAMYYAINRNEYDGEVVMNMFLEHFPLKYRFDEIKQKVLTDS